MNKNMASEDEKIKQFRTFRLFQRQELENKLYPEYAKKLTEFLDSVNKEYDELSLKYKEIDHKYDGWFGRIYSKDRDEAKSKLDECDSKRKGLKLIFNATSEREVRLREFDIETEQIILGAVCDVQSLCTHKKIFPELPESTTGENKIK